MINDTPKSPKARITQNVKRDVNPVFHCDFHLRKEPKRDKNNASKRSSNQSFTCG